MRFLHTGDWHLGRIMFGVRLTSDQAHVLEQLIDLVQQARLDAILVSGDVFDRAVPPPDAMELLDEFISRVVLGLRVPVIMIAGNHDSPQRLEFGSRVLAAGGVHLFGSVRDGAGSVILEDNAGPVHFYGVPYAEPALVRERLGVEEARNHHEAMEAILDQVRVLHPKGRRSVLLTHAFVAGGAETESERPLSVGGTDRVDPSCFSGFDYVALGHLHRPQTAGGDHIRYSGSLLKYSFSEATHTKVVNLVEMDERGCCEVETISLTPQRDVRRIEGCLEEVLAGPAAGENRDDYVMVTLHDEGPILDLMGKLRDVYPNVLHVERPFLASPHSGPGSSVDHRTLNDVDLFSSFFSQVTANPLSDAEAAVYLSVVEELRRQEREPDH